MLFYCLECSKPFYMIVNCSVWNRCIRNLSIYHIMDWDFLFPVYRRPCSVLSPIMSLLFPPCSHLYICGCQDFVSLLETDDNCSLLNFRYNRTPYGFLITVFWPLYIHALEKFILGCSHFVCNVFCFHTLFQIFGVWHCHLVCS